MKLLFLLALLGPAVATSPPLPGGRVDSDPNQKEVQEAARFAVQQINAQANSMYANMLVRVVKVQTQVVAGMMYHMTLELVRSTECRNDGQVHSLETCAYEKNSARLFEVSVVSQPWKPVPMELVSFKQLQSKVSSNDIEESAPAQDSAESVDEVLKTVSPQFNDFLSKFKPSYLDDAQELKKRSAIFEKNLRTIKKMNSAEQGTATYGVTRFADLTREEFRQQYAMPLGVLKPDPTMKPAHKVDVSAAPDSVDWRKKGAVTVVKNQGTCGSCWAFSTTGNIEGQWFIKMGKLVSLSEQELVDCDKVDKGCQGGLPSTAYKQIEALGGLETEGDYPYTGRDGSCSFVKSKAVVQINGSVALSTDEEQMAAWLAQNGPISIGINAAAMQFYHGGISHPWKIFCEPSHLDHGVLIVGYGTEEEKPYWIIKNSWGSSWGEEGYYRVYRGDGVCGLNRMPTSSVV